MSRRNGTIHAGVMAAAIVACYAGSIAAPFILDDEPSIVANPGIGRWEEYPRVEPATRRIAYLSFKLDYRLWGASPAGFRLTNIAIHLAATLAIYALGRTLLGSSPRNGGSPDVAGGPPGGSDENGGGEGRAAAWALAGALLFAVHPVQTQAVTYVVQRIASLSTLFYVTSLALFAWARLRASRRLARLGAHIVSVAMGLLAMRTKEIAFTLPFAVLLLEFAFGEEGSPRRRVLGVTPFVALLPVIPLTLLWSGASLEGLLAGSASGASLGGASDVASPAGLLGRHEYLATQARVVLTYLRLLLVPAGQNLDHDYPVEHSLMSGPVLASSAALAGVIAAGLTGLGRRRPPGLRVAGYGVLLFFLGLSVESTFFPIADVIFEHRMYLPMAGAALALAGLGHFLARRRPGMARPLEVAVGVWMLALGTATLARNRVWRDPVALWSDAARKSPGKARVHYNLGNAVLAKGDLSGARQSWERAVELDPRHSWALNQLGNLALLRGDAAAAESLYRRAIAGDLLIPETFYNLGMLLESSGRQRDAIPMYRRFIEMDPIGRRAEVEALRARLGI